MGKVKSNESKFESKIQEGKILNYRLDHNQDLVKELREKYKIPPEGLPFFYKGKDGEKDDDTGGQPIWDWENTLTLGKKQSFDDDIYKLMGKLKIPHRHFYFVRDYVQTNESDPIGVTGYPKIGSGIQTDPHTGEKSLVIIIDADTQPKDLQDESLWKKLRRLQKELVDYDYSPNRTFIRNLEKYKQIYEWHKEGLTYKQINQKLPSIGLKKHEDYQSVGTIISRYKKYVGVNLRHKRR